MTVNWRGPDDFYPTPAGATWALCNLGILPSDVWEPACGDGAMSRVLERAGRNVVSTNLYDRGFGEIGVDFLKCSSPRAPAIVTNPPFSLANNFVEHALDIGVSTACFLLRLKFLEGLRRRRLFARNQLQQVYVFSDHIVFKSGSHDVDAQPGWSTEAFAWFVWRADYQGPPTIGWVSRNAGSGEDFLS